MTTYSYNNPAQYPDPFILPKRALALPNGTNQILAGEVGKSTNFYGLVENDYTGNGVIGYLVIEQIIRVKKIVASVIADGALLKFVANPTGTKNDWWVDNVATTNPIHAVALEAAGNGVTTVLIKGPFRPPYQLAP